MISEDCIMYLSTQVIHFSLGNPFQSPFSLLRKEFACHGEVIVQCKCIKKKACSNENMHQGDMEL